MKKNVLVAMTGAIALALGVGLNTQNALNDYGIGENSLSLFVLAQTDTSGSSGGSDTNGFKRPEHYDCGVTVTGNISAAALALGFKLGQVTVGGSYLLINAGTECAFGGNYQCVYRDCVMVNQE